MKALVAANELNTLVVRQLRMARLRPRRLPPPDPKEKHTAFDLYLQGLVLEPLKQAYLLIRGPDRTDHWFLARTGDQGEIQVVPSLADDALRMPWMTRDGVSYAYFWTFSRSVMQRVHDVYRADPERAMTAFEFSGFSVHDQSRVSLATEEVIGWDQTLARQFQGRLQRLVFDTYFQRSWRGRSIGYYNSLGLNYTFPSAHLRSGDYLLVTSNALGALYAAELLYFHAASLWQREVPHHTVLKHVLDLASSNDLIPIVIPTEERPEAKDPPEKSEQEPRDRYADPDGISAKEMDRYNRFAFDCAHDPSISRSTFSETMGLKGTPVDWVLSGSSVDSSHPDHSAPDPRHTHPIWFIDTDGRSLETRELAQRIAHARSYAPKDYWQQLQRVGKNAKIVLNQFDYYRFRLEVQSRRSEWKTAAREFLAYAEKELQRIFDLVRRLCAQRLELLDFLVDLGSHHDQAYAASADLFLRYLELSSAVLHPWFLGLPSASDTKEGANFYEQVQPFLSNIADASDKFGELLHDHLSKRSTVQSMLATLLGLSAAPTRQAADLKLRDLAEAVLRKFMAADGKLTRGKRVPRELNSLVLKRTIKLGDQTAQVAVNQRSRATSLTVMRGNEVVLPEVLVTEKLSTQEVTVTTRRGKTRLQQIQVREPVLEAPWLNKPLPITRWPAWLAAFGDALSLVVGVAGLFAKQDSTADLRFWAVTSKNSFQLIDSASSALHLTWPANAHIKRLHGVSEKVFKKPGLALEVILNLVEGIEILTCADSEGAKAMRRGDEFEGYTQMARGIILTGGSGIGLSFASIAWYGAAAGQGVAAFMTTLGAAMAFVTIAGLALAVFAAVAGHTGPENQMDGLLKAFQEAYERHGGAGPAPYERLRLFREQSQRLVDQLT